MACPTPKKLFMATLSAAVLTATAAPLQAQTVDSDGLELVSPAWSLVFKRDGSVNRRRLDVGEAFSFADPVSNGRAVDPTVLFRRVVKKADGTRMLHVARNRVVQTTVRAANDLAHIYLVSGISPSTSRATYMAAEVLSRNASQNVVYEFELTQNRHDIIAMPGADRLAGSYSAGDLRALVTFKRGIPNDILIKRMQTGAGTMFWKSVVRKRFDASNCANDGDNVLACVTSLSNGGAIRSKPFGLTSRGDRVRLPEADMRIEIGLDIDELAGVTVSWDTMIVRSKYDIAVMPLVNGVTGTGTFSSPGGSVPSADQPR